MRLILDGTVVGRPSPSATPAGAYLAGINTRRVRGALAALFGGAVGKDAVSRDQDIGNKQNKALRAPISGARPCG